MKAAKIAPRPTAPERFCECCGIGQRENIPGDGFACGCTTDLRCRRCNRCLKHCSCAAAPDPDLPLAELAADAKAAWRRMGVRV